MVVGDDIAVVGDEEAGTLAQAAVRLERTHAVAATIAELLRAAALAELLEEVEQRMVGRQILELLGNVAPGIGDFGAHLDGDDRRPHGLHHGGEIGRGCGRLHLDRSSDRDMAVDDGSAEAGGSGNTDREGTCEQRVADAPRSPN